MADIELPAGPVVSVASVKYYDDTNTLQTVDPSKYFLADSLVPKLKFATGFEASTYLREDAVQVDYVAGYPADEDDYRANVPASVKQAILLLTQAYFDALTPQQMEAVRNAAQNMLRDMRVVTL